MPNLHLPVWLRGTPLRRVWLDVWEETGRGDLALEAVRRDPRYDDIFPGNRREDGTLRYDENTYFAHIESFQDTLLSVNVNPDLFQGKFADLISGLVSPSEFASRVNAMYDRVLTASQQIKDYYAAEFAFDMTDSAIVASFLDPDVGQAVLNRQISIAEVGGEAASRNFTVGRDLAEKLVNAGLDTVQEAQGYFAEAETMIPTLAVLAKRHADPNDEFNLEDFTNATLFGDPQSRVRMRRLLAQERSTFSGDEGIAIQRDQMGSLTGLAER